MSEEHAEPHPSPSPTPAAQPAPATKSDRPRNTIIIRMWPKTPVLYPMAIVALVCSLLAHFAGSSALSDYPFERDAVEERAEAPDGANDAAPVPQEGAQAAPLQTVLPAQADADADVEPAGDADPVAVVTTTTEDEEMAKKRVDRTLAVVFLVALFFSLFAICVDLDVRWAIIYASIIVIGALLLWILNITTGILPKLFGFLDHITPMANAQLYFGVFAVWLALMVISFIVTRFHYVKVEAKEVIVVGGMLERQQRYDTMRMRYTKEIHDVMEYYLPFVRSGRLIFSFPEQSEAVIIDNVINIKKVAQELDRVVGSSTDHYH